MTVSRPLTRSLRWTGLALVLTLLLVELFAVHFARHLLGFECYTARYAFCDVARNVLLASYCTAAGLVLLGLFARSDLRDLLAEAGLRKRAVALNLAGLAALFATLPALKTDLSSIALMGLALVWVVAILATVAGVVLMLAPLPRWQLFVRRLGWHLPMVLGAGAAATVIAVQIRPYWRGEVLADWTFGLVSWLMRIWGQEVETDPAAKVIGADGFYVNVAPSCSGIEGLVLTTTFSLIYLVLFRRDLRFPQALLILPVALLASWCLNAVRIAVLVQIGISGRPELAVGGFHSHAGWLMFTLLSLGIVLTTQSVGVFRKTGDVVSTPAPLPPFLSDPMVAQILPFAIFMASALLASTFSATPALVYPLRAVAMAVALGLVWRTVAALPWRIDPLAVATGICIAVYWIVLSPPPAPYPAMAGLTGLTFGLWLLTRVIGTTVLVPIIEELFFRGYLLGRIAPKGAERWRLVFGVIVTSALFAALHDRWIAAAMAGVLFAALTLRSRNLTDAILAHGVANGLIAAWAVSTGNWAVI